MKLSDVKAVLPSIEKLRFQLPDESFVPDHFHVTEVGVITKNFIDCGGTIRTENKINFQLWEDGKDIDHELKPSKLLDIIQLSEKVLGMEDAEIEVEYQEFTIGKYQLEFDGAKFLLQNTMTDCLAKDQCGVPAEKTKLEFANVGGEEVTACVPGNGCC
jgi:hypothetical protein